MKHKIHGQMSDSFLTAAFLSVSGGLQDAYTYIFRGKVFANAQTGNIVLLSQSIAEKNWHLALHYLVPLVFFALGIAVSEFVHIKYRKIQKFHWRQLVVLNEIILLFGRFPASGIESSCQRNCFIFMCNAGTGIQKSKRICICKYNVHRQYEKRC